MTDGFEATQRMPTGDMLDAMRAEMRNPRGGEREMLTRIWNAAVSAMPATQPPAVGVDVPDDWRIKAAEWLERKAQEQEANNAKWPEHAAAYESWRQRPTEYRILANCARTAALSRTDGESA